MTTRRFPPPWTIERLPGAFKVVDAHGQSLAYFYARENDNDANTAGVLTMDEARRIATNFAKLPELLGAVRTLGRERLDRSRPRHNPYSKVIVVTNGGSGSLFDSDQAIVVRTAITTTIHTVLRPNRSAMTQLLSGHA
jgi:hypothetical protein